VCESQHETTMSSRQEADARSSGDRELKNPMESKAIHRGSLEGSARDIWFGGSNRFNFLSSSVLLSPYWVRVCGLLGERPIHPKLPYSGSGRAGVCAVWILSRAGM